MEVQFLVFFLNLGEEESNKNDDSNFEISLHFEAAIVAELLSKQSKIFKLRIFSHSLNFYHERFTPLISSANLTFSFYSR